MAAMKRFYEECAAAGRCPISEKTWSYLDKLERADPTLDWIEYDEHEFVGHDGRLYLEDCITIRSARRLLAEGLANDEVEFLVECFGGHCPA